MMCAAKKLPKTLSGETVSEDSMTGFACGSYSIRHARHCFCRCQHFWISASRFMYASSAVRSSSRSASSEGISANMSVRRSLGVFAMNVQGIVFQSDSLSRDLVRVMRDVEICGL
jgi:hypothetical protein